MMVDGDDGERVVPDHVSEVLRPLSQRLSLSGLTEVVGGGKLAVKQEEPAMSPLAPSAADLRRLTRTDPDPHVRHRDDALVLLAHGRTVTESAHDAGCSDKRIRAWRVRYLTEGRVGLADRPRPGVGHPSWEPRRGRCWRPPWGSGRSPTTIR
jgi:hypothetical protein